MMNVVRETVKVFLSEALELKTEEAGEEVRIIGIDHTNGGWIAEAEVVERDRTLPKHRVFEKKYYLVKLNGDLEVSSYKQVKSKRDREKEYKEYSEYEEGIS
jgi:hypothetical protein